MTIKTLLFGGLAAATLLSAAAPALAQTSGSVDAAATADAAAFVQTAQARLARGQRIRARDAMERAETVLLNKAEYDGTATINPGTGMVLSGPLGDVAQARRALQGGQVRLAANDLARY